jgi:hypothetical protein
MKKQLLKKFEILLVVLAYIALFVFFLIVAYVAINFVKGKRFDWQTRSWTPNGMIIFASKPSNANLIINGKIVKHKSGSSVFPKKLNIFTPGTYEIRVSRDGYKDWVKKFEINPSSLHWAHYIWLIKEDINYRELFGDINVVEVFQYGESSKVILATKDEETQFNKYYLADLNDRKKKIELPTYEDDVLNSVMWSASGNKFMAKITNSELVSYKIYQGRNFDDVTDITDVFKLDFSDDKIEWSQNNENELYYVSNNNLFRLNFDNKYITAPLLSNVLGFSVVKDKIISARFEDESQEVNLWQIDASGNNSKVLFSALPVSDSYEIKCTQGCEKILVLGAKNGNLKVITQIKGKLHSQQLSQDIIFANWSGDGKKILYGTSNQVFVYDYEKEQEYIIHEGKKAIARWYPDSHHVIIDHDEKMIIVNFDGFNKTQLASQVKGITFYQYDFSNFYFFGESGLTNFKVD